ncbi:multidrug efflux MFS transporter MdtH [Paludibacterium paludis]|uniref:Multidrug resistance protein MdtH n=1 Tax=Paludibacterium paludis TaxID=1225769 RepID=A0A918P1D0_9NEIS|nr:multidrug efflux MFS transporter MdtH [Paludibacterium paludis]GGY12001.1 multidrug resistance protein MdtH [Paludibacterium paludis]
MTPASPARRFGKCFIVIDNLLVVAGFFVVFPLVSLHFVDRLGWAGALVGAALALRQLAQQGFGLVGGSLADRFGAKPLIVAGMLVRAAGFAVLAAADTPSLLILACLLSAFGGTLFEPPRSALAVKFTRPRERSRFYALLMMCDSAGAVGAALLGSWLMRYDFRWVAGAGAGLFLAAALINALFLPRWRIASRREPILAGMRRVLADAPFRRLVLTLSGYYALLVQVMLTIPVALRHLSGSDTVVGGMYALETALSLTLLYPLARLGERYFSLPQRLMAGLALMTACLGLMALAGGVTAMFLLLGGFYLGTLIAEPARETLVAGMADPARRGSYLGFGRIGFALGGGLGHFGGGMLYDLARREAVPELPWIALFAVGALTLAALARQLGVARRGVLAGA